MVYTDGYDSHSLRAYKYYKSQMPEIELAKENEFCYTIQVGTKEVLLKASDTIKYQEKEYSGVEFYELATNKRL